MNSLFINHYLTENFNYSLDKLQNSEDILDNSFDKQLEFEITAETVQENEEAYKLVTGKFS